MASTTAQTARTSRRRELQNARLAPGITRRFTKTKQNVNAAPIGQA
jgi:hypothetical protein